MTGEGDRVGVLPIDVEIEYQHVTTCQCRDVPDGCGGIVYLSDPRCVAAYWIQGRLW